MTIGDGVDFSTTLINKTTTSKSKCRVFGNPYEFALAKPTVEGLTPGKTMCLTSTNWILNNLILEYDQFCKILILDCELRLLPDRIVTYNLDFRSFRTRKGETTIFQKNREFIF